MEKDGMEMKKHNAMNVRDCFNAGREWGHSLASWNASSIQFGMTLCRSIDWEGIGTVSTVSDWLSAFDMVIGAADESARCYSPFECTAHAINLRDEVFGECSAECGWDAFERGMQAGANAYRRHYYPVRELKRDLKEWENASE